MQESYTPTSTESFIMLMLSNTSCSANHLFPPPFLHQSLSPPSQISDKFVTLFISAGLSASVQAVWGDIMAGRPLTQALSVSAGYHRFCLHLSFIFLMLFSPLSFPSSSSLFHSDPRWFLLTLCVSLLLTLSHAHSSARLRAARRNNLPHAALLQMIEA